MMNIVCFKWGKEFDASYVNKLYHMIEKNVTVPHNFICFTEDPEGLECEARPFVVDLPHWWYIIGLFSKQHGFKDTVLYLDLDTIILKNIDDIISTDCDFATIRDFYRPKGLQTALIKWEPDFGYYIFDKLEKLHSHNYSKLHGLPGGTNKFLEDAVGLGPEVVRLQDLYPDELVSYKVHIRDKQQPIVWDKVHMVFFHGRPRPHEVNKLDWMQEHWN